MVELPLCILDKIMLYISHPLSDVFKAHVQYQDLFHPHRHKVLWVGNSEKGLVHLYVTSDDENPVVSAMIERRVFSRTIATRSRTFYPDLSYTHRLHLLYGTVSLHLNRDILAQIKDKDMDQEYERFYALTPDTQVDSGSEDEDAPYMAFMEDGGGVWTFG
jgi:hypothetical protein